MAFLKKEKKKAVPVPAPVVLSVRGRLKREAVLDLAAEKTGTMSVTFVLDGLTPEAVGALLGAVDDEGLISLDVRGFALEEGSNDD